MRLFGVRSGQNGMAPQTRHAPMVLAVAVAMLFLSGPLSLVGTVEAQSSKPTVSERTGQVYDATIEPGERATFKWEIMNPTNTTWEFMIIVMSDNLDLNGVMDQEKVQVFSGQTDTVILKVTTDASETTKAKFTLVFSIRSLSTNETLTAYKTATVKVDVTHGVDFHGLFTLQPGWLGLEDNDYSRVLLVMLFYLLLAFISIGVVLPVAGLISSKTNTKIDDIILGIIRKPIFVLIMFYGFLDAIELMEFLPHNLTDVLRTLFGLGVLVVIIYMAYKLFKGVVIEFGKEFAAKTETEIDDILIPVIEKIGVVLIAVFGVMGILSYFGVDVTMAATGVGVAGLVLAFAAQNSIANFFGGIFILLDRPFKVGDIILIDTAYCRVEHIGLRSTRVYDIFQNNIIVIPNDQLANSKITNLSAPDANIRIKVYWDAPYGIDTEMFTNIMLDTVKNSPKELGIIKDNPKKAIWCHLNDLKASSMQFVVGFWVEDLMKQWDAASYVRSDIYKNCAKKNIEIPFPQMDVHIKHAPKDLKL